MLSSDVLESQFGPTKLVVISQDQKYRVIETVEKKNNTVLEVSFVTFNLDAIGTYLDIHQKIIDGSSMGKAFREAGIKFIRDVRSISHNSAAPHIQNRFGRDGLATIIEVDILIGPDKLQYCHINENYNPMVVWPES